MGKQQTLFSTKTTIGLLIFLAIPFLIRSSAPSLEPYPSILLPLGIGLFNVEQTEIEIKKIAVLGKNSKGEWQEIEAADFMKPMPRYFFYKIAENEFGLKERPTEAINTAFWGRIDVPKKANSLQDIQETKLYIKNRLKSLDLVGDTLKFERSLVTMSLETKEVLNIEIVEEVFYELD